MYMVTIKNLTFKNKKFKLKIKNANRIKNRRKLIFRFKKKLNANGNNAK